MGLRLSRVFNSNKDTLFRNSFSNSFSSLIPLSLNFFDSKDSKLKIRILHENYIRIIIFLPDSIGIVSSIRREERDKKNNNLIYFFLIYIKHEYECYYRSFLAN